jgi:hypothetical protein
MGVLAATAGLASIKRPLDDAEVKAMVEVYRLELLRRRRQEGASGHGELAETEVKVASAGRKGISTSLDKPPKRLR